MRKSFPTPTSQGSAQSCTAFATAYGLRTFLERQKRGWADDDPGHIFSPAFIYNIFCNGDRETGLKVQNALTFMVGGGCCTLKDMPYDPNDCGNEPTDEIRVLARDYKMDEWQALDIRNIQKVKTYLASGTPVVVVAFVDPPDSWAVNEKGVTDHYSTDGPKPKKVLWTRQNCHAMILVGYDGNKEAFEVMNSWGPEWQDKGFGWIAYSFWPTWVHEGYIVPKPKLRRIGPPGASVSSKEVGWLPVGPNGTENGNWGYSTDIKLNEVERTPEKTLPAEIKEELAPVLATESPSPTPTPMAEATATPAPTPSPTPERTATNPP